MAAQRRRRGIVASALLLLLALAGAWLWTPDLDRAELEARYARGSADFVELAGIRLHVRDDGPKDAPAVLLLHGFGASLHTWDDWAQALAPRHRVIRLDLPAAGLTGPDPSGDYSDERALQLVTALLDRLGVARATVVGHSMGGRIAWRLAAAQPQRVHRLVLVAPDGFASPGFPYGQAPEVGPMVELMRFVLPRPLVTMSLRPAYADPAQMTEARATRYHELLRAPGVRSGLVERMRQLVLRDPVPILKTIAAPTLLLWGERDAMVPVSNAQDYLRALPRAKLVTLPGVGHIPQEEGGDAALAALQAFLAE